MVSYNEKGEITAKYPAVLILIVVDNGLVRKRHPSCAEYILVLILIVVDNGLVPSVTQQCLLAK